MTKERIARSRKRAASLRRRGVLMLTVLSVSATIIASPTPKSKTVNPVTSVSKHRWFEIGKASWYGKQFQGHSTANGESFDMNALTCAHRSLPLGSWIRVTNLRNHKATFVRVNDRGPMLSDRILDVSFAAAQKLGLRNLAPVKIEPVASTDTALVAALLADLPDARSSVVLSR